VEDDVAGSCSKNSTDPSPMMKKKSDLLSKWTIKQDSKALVSSHIIREFEVDVVLATSLQFTGS